MTVEPTDAIVKMLSHTSIDMVDQAVSPRYKYTVPFDIVRRIMDLAFASRREITFARRIGGHFSAEANRWLCRYPLLILRNPLPIPASTFSLFPGSTIPVFKPDEVSDDVSPQAITILIDASWRDLTTNVSDYRPGNLDSTSPGPAARMSELVGRDVEVDTVYLHYRRQADIDLPSHREGHFIPKLDLDLLSSIRGSTLILGTSLSQASYEPDSTDSGGGPQLRPESKVQHSSSTLGFTTIIQTKDFEPKYKQCFMLFDYTSSNAHLVLIHRASALIEWTTWHIARLLVATIDSGQSVTLVLDPTCGISGALDDITIDQILDPIDIKNQIQKSLSSLWRQKLPGPKPHELSKMTETMERLTICQMDGMEMRTYAEALRLHRDTLEYLRRQEAGT